MRRADARAGLHGDHAFDRHRHVDQHAVALADAERLEAVREPADAVVELPVGHLRHDAVVGLEDDRDLFRVAVREVAIETVVGDIELAVVEPLVERRARLVERLRERLVPEHLVPRELRPESGEVLRGGGIERVEIGLLHVRLGDEIEPAVRKSGVRSIPIRSWTCCHFLPRGPTRRRPFAVGYLAQSNQTRAPSAIRHLDPAQRLRDPARRADARAPSGGTPHGPARTSKLPASDPMTFCPSEPRLSRCLHPVHEPLAAAAALPRPHRRPGRLRLVLHGRAHRISSRRRSAARTRSRSSCRNVTPAGAETVKAPPETLVMLVVLGLIDVVMISNLLIMVIVGGYETFVSRMRARGPSRPAGVAVARQRERAQGQARDRDHRHLVDPSAEDVHQCERRTTPKVLIAQTTIHVTFLLSALAIAAVDRIMPQGRALARSPRPATTPH